MAHGKSVIQWSRACTQEEVCSTQTHTYTEKEEEEGEGGGGQRGEEKQEVEY